MTFPFRTLPALLLLLAASPPQTAQPAPDATITFGFDRPGLPVPTFLLTLHRDGTGTYAATVLAPTPDTSRYGAYAPATPVPPTQITRPITLSAQTTAQLFEQVQSTHRFHGGCESKAKNIANTGAKTLTYSGPDGEGRCVYNYTEIKAVASVTDTFFAIAFTLDEGRKLEQAHRYDRLGLDQEMRYLVDAVHEGHAVELDTIAPVLTSIAQDTQVLERVRNRAAALLATATPAR